MNSHYNFWRQVQKNQKSCIMPSSRVCFHFLLGTCDYGEECWKQHVAEDKLSETQASAFANFRKNAPGQEGATLTKTAAVAAIQQKPRKILKRPEVPNPSTVTAAAKAEEEEIVEVPNEDNIDSCFDFPRGNCSRFNCKWIHRDLGDFTDDELDRFQVILKKSWPKVCFAALNGDCDDACGRVHKLETDLSYLERVKWERYQQNAQ